MRDAIRILREFNVIDPTDLVDPITIWVCVGDSDRYEETGTKVAGPVPIRFGDPMIDGLKGLLERLGYEVVVETTADD
jgi:hypothetical protein